MSPRRCLASTPPAALSSLLTALLLLVGGAGPPLARALPFPSASPADALGDADAEMDSDATQRVLGSSVVTSVSVIMDLGNGTKVLTEPGPMPRPGERIPAVASPASLMHPDRYEFYTFDEAGDLVKRYMTLPQIQSMIAGGDGSPAGGGLPLQPLGEGRVPAADAVDAPPAPPAPLGVVVADHQGEPTALGVREVVDRVQNVLRSELEANKNKVPTPGASPPTAPLAEEPGDASGAWSVLLPAMMGSAVETASPSTPAATSPTPVATNATTDRAAATTPAPTAPQHDEDAPQPTTLKSVPSETPSTEASPSKPDVTEVPTTIKPAESSTLKHVPTQGSTPEIVTEASLSTSSSSNLSGSSESDESPQSSEDVSLSTSGSLASESEESEEGSTESNAAPPDTQSPQDDAALSKPPQTPSATAQAPASPPPAQPETTVKTTAAPPKTTPYPISSETPMLLTVVEPSPETPMLIPVFEPSPPTLLDDDMNRPILLPQKPLFRPIVVPEERVPITTEEPDFPQQSADQSQDNPAEVLKPASSDGIVPPVTEQSEVQTTLRPFTVVEKTTPPSEQGPSSSPTSEEPDQEAQSQKIPPLFLGLLPPFPDPLEDGPSMPDEIPLLLDPVPMLSTDTATDPPITTYRPPFTTTVSSTARPTTQQETTEPEVPTQTVRPTRAPEVSETTAKITTIPADIGLKTSAASDSTEKEPTQPETQPPRAEPTATTEQPPKAKEPEKPEETDDTDTAESDSSQLKGVAGTTLPPVTEERPLPETPSSTESKETTFAETTFAPSALPRTPSTPSTPRQPETEHPAELDISEELADSLSSVLSQVAEQPTTILIDPSTSDAILKVDDQKEDQPEPVYIATPQVTEQPKAPTTTAPNEKTPEQSTEADSATSAGTAVKATLPANGGTHDTTTNVPADTTPSADKAQPNPEVHTTIPTVGQPSLVTLNVADVTELRQQTTTTTELPDDRENKVTPRPVTVALVELAPVFKNPSSIQPPQLFRIASSTTTTTTTTPEEEPSATDKTMHILGSGEEEEFINNKEIEKDIEKEAEDEKENDALVKRQEEAETQANQEATTEAKSPEITTIPQKTEETFVATTTPKASTPFKIVVQDSPVIYEDEDTFNSYTATPQSSSPSPFTATPSAPSTEPPSIPDATNPPATPPAAQQTTVPEATPDAIATTLKAKDEPVLLTTPAIKLLPPESLNMGSDKEGTDMVNNSQEDEDVHSHKDSKPLSKIVPEDFPIFVPAATAIPEVYKVRPTTIPPTQAATEVPATTLPPTKADDQDPSPEGATEAYNTRYEESSITDTAPGTETPAPETPAADVATTEKEVATTLVEESETTKTEDDTTKNEETTVSKEEGTPQATDAPTTLNDDQPIQETTQPAEESTDAEEVAESTAYPILKKEAAPEATTLQDETAEATDTTVNPVKEDATTQPSQGTEAPATETLAPEETDKPVETEKPTLYNAPTEAESPAETEKPIVNETPAETEAPAVTEQVADETPLVTEKPTETEKPSEEETPAVTEKSDATEVPAITEKAAETAKPEEMEKPTETEKPTVTENQAETEKPTETQKPEEEDDSVMMEPATGTTTAPVTSSDKPAVEEKLESSSSSSPVLTKIGDHASPEAPEDPVVVLITKPPVINNFGVKDSAHDIRPTSRPRPPPAVQFQPLASTLAPLTRPPPPHQPAVQVTPAPQLRPTQFDQGPGGHPPVSLAPAPGENLGLEVTTVALGGDVRKFADLCNELAFRLWGAVTVRGLHSGRSVVMSPMGVTSTLAMVFLGARGPTSGQMNDILKLDDMVTFNPHQVFRNVTESVVLGRHPGIATAAFVRELYSDRSKGRLLDFYKERAQQFYDGHVEEVNFSVISDLVRRRTNMLVKRQTRGRVPEYLRGSHIQLHPPLAAFGANIFQTDCSAASTEGRDGEMYFTVLPGSRQRRLVLVPAAVWRSDFLAGYEPHLDCTAAAIGGAESLVSVVLLLPGQQGQLAPGDGVAALERRLTEPAYRRGAWARVLRSLLPRPGLELQLPRFSHRSLLNVTAALQRMGLRDLFSAEKADLRGLNGVANDLHLSDIVQVNTFSTCAEGTTGGRHHAEVYPSGGGGGGGGRAGRGDLSGVPLALRPRQGREPEPAPAPAPRLRFDRPFIYAVRHNPTGFILHMGRFNPHLLH